MFEPSHLDPNLNKMMEEYAKGEEEAVQELNQEHCRMKKGKKQKQRLSNQQKKPEREKLELKKLKLRKGRKKKAIWFQRGLISLGGTSCSIRTSLVKEVSAG